MQLLGVIWLDTSTIAVMYLFYNLAKLQSKDIIFEWFSSNNYLYDQRYRPILRADIRLSVQRGCS